MQCSINKINKCMQAGKILQKMVYTCSYHLVHVSDLFCLDKIRLHVLSIDTKRKEKDNHNYHKSNFPAQTSNDLILNTSMYITVLK